MSESNTAELERKCASVRDDVEMLRDELITLCADLVSANSVNPPGDTRDVADKLVRFLGRYGIDAELVASEPTMPSVLATIDGSGSGPRISMNAHLDTMDPGDTSLWSVPAYELTRKDGKLFGLGTGNMKGAAAAMALALVVLARYRREWRGHVTLTAVSDECVFGPNGAAHLLQTRSADVLGDAMICGEGPGFRRLAVGEKGVAWYELGVSASGGHSSLVRQSTSATARLALAVTAVDAMTGEMASRPEELSGIDIEPETWQLSANVGVISGGTFISQIATSAQAKVDVRLPPGMSISEFEQKLKQALKPFPDISWRQIRAWEANWCSPASPLVKEFQESVEKIRGSKALLTIRMPASDASRWRALGIPSVCYGPQPTFAAGIDDYIEEQELIDCAKIYADVTLRFLLGGRS